MKILVDESTPDTNAAERMALAGEYMVPTEAARKLERERDEAREEIIRWKNKWKCAINDIVSLSAQKSD
jgi:hypothetical protein